MIFKNVSGCIWQHTLLNHGMKCMLRPYLRIEDFCVDSSVHREGYGCFQEVESVLLYKEIK